VTECSDVTVFVRLRACACHNTMRTLSGLNQGWTQRPTLVAVLYQVLRVRDSEQ